MQSLQPRCTLFQSTPPARGATSSHAYKTAADAISIHAPREGGDLHAQSGHQQERDFNPRPPRGGRPPQRLRRCPADIFQSTPPARGATATARGFSRTNTVISIHAPREGGDGVLQDLLLSIQGFQSTPPARGATFSSIASAFFLTLFQSTPPARGATRGNQLRFQISVISIHAPREGGDVGLIIKKKVIRYFNPRPPRGGRLAHRGAGDGPTAFQSTPPARGATPPDTVSAVSGGISIHAPREGGDIIPRIAWYVKRISIHAPREGGDGDIPDATAWTVQFQSTPPARGATATPLKARHIYKISIHAPREGGDLLGDGLLAAPRDFNPRPPRGGRQLRLGSAVADLVFQSTPPARGATKRGGAYER